MKDEGSRTEDLENPPLTPFEKGELFFNDALPLANERSLLKQFFMRAILSL